MDADETNLASLLNLRNGSAHSLHTVASDHELILLLCALDDAALLHDNAPNHLLAEVVADLNQVVGLRSGGLIAVDVDGEMCVYELHLILITLGHANHHVADVTANRANGGQFLLGSKPLLHLPNHAK